MHKNIFRRSFLLYINHLSLARQYAFRLGMIIYEKNRVDMGLFAKCSYYSLCERFEYLSLVE
jgi:hypothetical protein